MTFTRALQGSILFAIGLLIMLGIVGQGHCSIPGNSTKNKNSLGTVSYDSNPYAYEAGALITAFDIQDGKGLVVRMQPMATYNLFTEDILLCGRPLEMFEGKQNPLVLTYRIQASRAIKGVGCHTLVRVDELKDRKVTQ
jgi:hypothetical protein